ncbi:MAG TPA: DEAD/DEAH box helicase, partial [Myxococcota bacterium]|nr:DEAD/DEAH box helicase [Myxococcota bacterium]
MARLEDFQPQASVKGILPGATVTVRSVIPHGTEAIDVSFRTPSGTHDSILILRCDESKYEVSIGGSDWTFNADGKLFRLVSEAMRIRLAYLFDPRLAVHTSRVTPYPHQITAVYECMLPRQPLRFLLADDPGAGKTIMAGLLIKELMVRGDVLRCLIVCPGNLGEQWQDELNEKFDLRFQILTNDNLEASRTGNWFVENNLVIARLDKLSRNENIQKMLQAPDAMWDLVVCDEAHKMAATVFGGEIKYTKRYHLGELLAGVTRHFL